MACSSIDFNMYVFNPASCCISVCVNKYKYHYKTWKPCTTYVLYYRFIQQYLAYHMETFNYFITLWVSLTQKFIEKGLSSDVQRALHRITGWTALLQRALHSITGWTTLLERALHRITGWIALLVIRLFCEALSVITLFIRLFCEALSVITLVIRLFCEDKQLY
jgi:hypothetical protein